MNLLTITTESEERRRARPEARERVSRIVGKMLTMVLVSLFLFQAEARPALAGHLVRNMVSMLGQQSSFKMPTKLESGSEARDNTVRLTTELHWYQSLPAACAEAAREHKLVFWMNMVGNIYGKT